ncbi:cell wall-binding repeat-containing protein [Ornithinimicrobium faecis]|uniref:cell wall-binding repeat-containing protein n=1 Tax=Ornithinimicrobium faecis TaxID=2934158 RepID=UPI002119223A|nr:cell wall-binding repeat-containing protein [Ornithinimicrobium sp. HY1745]
MRRPFAIGVLSLALVTGGAVAGAAIATKDAEADRSTARHHRSILADRPDEIISDGAVTRIFGANRFATAAAIAEAYGWTGDNTIAVYIASGAEYPDALAIGLSSLQDGPLLLVNPSTIPSATREALTSLKPCYIDVLGGKQAINDSVLKQLKVYADPAPCQMLPAP